MRFELICTEAETEAQQAAGSLAELWSPLQAPRTPSEHPLGAACSAPIAEGHSAAGLWPPNAERERERGTISPRVGRT